MSTSTRSFSYEDREEIARLTAALAERDEDIRRIAEVFGRMHEADGHAPFPASVDELVRRAETLTRAEEERSDARAALSEHRHAALLAAGIHGGPGAWRWRSDDPGTILDDVAAWERLLGEMREARLARAILDDDPTWAAKACALAECLLGAGEPTRALATSPPQRPSAPCAQ